MSFTLCTSNAAAYKAGADASATVLASTAILNEFADETEGFIEQETNTDWVSNYASLSTSIKQALSDIASSLIAIKIINYDLGGYDTQRQVETLLDVNDNIAAKGLQNLKGK